MDKNKKEKVVQKVVQKPGKRKTSVARATIKKGTGKLKINKIPLELYSTNIYRLRISEPLILAGDIVKKIDIDVNVFGGGVSSQAEAVRLSIAKSLVEYFDLVDLKKLFLEYDRTLLVADTRYKETRKPMTHSKARRKRQQSYR